jgi:hypothetical protein
MKKLWVIITAAVIGLLASCPSPDGNNPNNPPVNPDNKTFIVFDNTQGICTVVVYDHYQRREEDKVAEIPAGRVSEEIEWTPGISVPFYFLYRINLKGINGFTLNYVPEIGKDQKAVRIDPDITTTIKVPTLTETVSSPDVLLSNSSYIFIQNNSSFSFELHRGNSKLKPDNIFSPLVNTGERAQYTINPAPTSDYQLLVGADYYQFPTLPVNFVAGYIYIFDFNGSISLVSDTELKLENVNGFSIPHPPTAPVVITSNGSITLQWAAVASATAYEIWMSTVNDSDSASKYGADVTTPLSVTISGLNNGTTYYIWLKAKNILGTSDFSPVAAGAPSAFTVKPPDPLIAPSIIAGNGQLTVSWQAVENADVYEIWTGATNNTQTAAKRGGDVSGCSAVISGLTNGTAYYVWIKAKNNIGVSGFSPVASGKPLGTPGIPTVSQNGYNQLLVTWIPVAGADQYEVYYGIDAPTTLATTTTATTATITGLAGDTTYYICIRAKNANGVSDYGPNASGTPKDALTPGLYRGTVKIGNQNLADSLTYISSNAASGDDFYIVLGANEFISPTILNYSGKTVGITLLGYGSEKRIFLNTNGSMFTVNSSVTLTLDENITLVGGNDNNNCLVTIYGNLIMNDRAKITGNYTSSSKGGGVRVDGSNAIFIMNGGEISDNTISYYDDSSGGGVYVSQGTFTMNGGVISGNTVSAPSPAGGGVYIYGSSATFTMNGGKISNNISSYSGSSFSYGGGVYLSSGIFNMNSGVISGNKSTSSYSSGGGVLVSSGTFTMRGGIISGNSAFYGGGVHNFGTFKKLPPLGEQNSGIIYGSEAVGNDTDGIPLKNTSSNWGNAVYLSSNQQYNTTVGQTDYIR